MTVQPGSITRGQAYRFGMRNALSVPGAVLVASFFGFGAFARGSGFELGPAIFTAGIFALPGQVVLADAVAGGAGLIGATIAVTLTAVRLLPLTVALMPLLREERTPVWQQMLLSHFVAVTVWVESMRRVPDLPRHARIPFYSGMALTLLPAVMLATIAGHVAAGAVPLPLAAGLLFLTPIYFLLSMLSAAREWMDVAAIVAGLVLGPVFYLYTPGLDLLLSGLVGGTAVYALSRWLGR